MVFRRYTILISLIFLSGCSLFGGKIEIESESRKKTEVSEEELLGLSPNPDESRPLVIIDPGHGGEDLGALGPEGLKEKEYVLEVAKELSNLIRTELKLRTKLTRSKDEFIQLTDRTKFANENKAWIFVSLHANASVKKKVSGFQTFYLDTTNDEASKLLAERENASMGNQNISDVEFILSDLIQTAKLDDSIILSHMIQNETLRSLKKKYPEVDDKGVRKAPFFVLVGAHMPCVLVEMLFIDNVKDAKLIKEPTFKSDIARGIFEGIRVYGKRTGVI